MSLAGPSSIDLPSYTPSGPVPSYSYDLACGEQRLQHTPRLRSTRLPPTSTFTKKLRSVSIALTEQFEGATIPVYGRGALISGFLSLERPEDVLEVVAHVEGKLDSTISEAGGKSTKVLNDHYKLWSHTSSPHHCRHEIPFAFLLPTTFEDGDKASPLPPSFHEHPVGVPALFVKSHYALRFSITRIRHKRLAWFTKTKSVLIPFKYYPRTRAHRPIIPSPCFFSAVKTSPEEWFQAVTCLKTRGEAKVDPIQCHLFIPSARIYSLKDVIPFHVQLTAKICSLRDLFAASLDRVKSTDSDETDEDVPFKPNPDSKLIRVYLLRQVTVTIRGSRSWRNKVLAEGTLWPVPPDLSGCCDGELSSCREGHVDWDGELRIKNELDAGSFTVANIEVKDFIALSLSPPNADTSPLLELQMTVPIRLVTDPFTDAVDLDSPSP